MNKIARLHLRQRAHPRLRMPRNRSACLWYLLDVVSRGHRYHLSGHTADGARLERFAEKMHDRWGVLLSASGRLRRRRAGHPTGHLVTYQDWDGVWLWWLLVAGPQARVHEMAQDYGEAVTGNGRRTC